MKFSQFHYERPDMDAACQFMNNLTQKFEASTTAKEQIDIIADYRTKLIQVSSMMNLSYIRNTVDINGEYYKNEQAFFDKVGPTYSSSIVDFGSAVLKSKFLDEIKGEYGEIFISNLEFDSKSISKEIIPLMEEENELVSQYQRFNANAMVSYNGKEYTIPAISKLTTDKDRNIRKAATQALSDFYRSQKDFLEGTYDKLVKNRTAQAHTMGFESFTQLGYIRQNRNSYTPNDVANFRKQIAEDIVPVIIKAKEKQAERIGVSKIAIYDDNYCFADGNPKAFDDSDKMIQATKEVFSMLSPALKEYIEFMIDNECYDAPERVGKRVGAYSFCVPLEHAPYVFLNYNGSDTALTTTFHEFGHGFEFYLQRFNDNSYMTGSTMDISEIHSMSMEFLFWPGLNKFFNDIDIRKYKISQLEKCLSFLSYGTMVDHFQHIIYDNPELTPDERNQKWAELERIYRPYIDFDNIEFYSDGCLWQRQQHLYSSPFYYIDYVLAQTIALQFWQLAEIDHNASLEKYVELAKKGGSLKFTDLVRSVGLKVPFEAGALIDIAKAVEKSLETL
ncbi:MAG: M3 family oligoendopeptidase [Oscillospiraceae bacterium]